MNANVENRQDIRILVDPNGIFTFVSEFEQVQVNGDFVTLNFLQFIPTGPNEPPSAKLLSRISMSWSHFAKFVSMCNSVISHNREMARTEFMNSVFSEEIG